MHARLLFLVSLLSFAAGAASSIDTKAISSAADPCVDFYQYACGNWIAQNPLPADRSRWGRFTELSDHNEKVLLGLVQTAASSKAPRGSLDQKVGDYFRSCMDTAAIEKKGMAPVRPELDRIQGMRDRADLAAEVARLHRQGINVLFRFTSEPDPKDSAHMIAGFTQGGLSLPDRDYYLKADAKSVETRQRFEQHVANMFQLANEAPDAARRHAHTVLELETLLAQPALDRVSRRDPEKTYHPMPRTELAALAPGFSWDDYFHGVGAPAFDRVDVEWPDYVKALPLDQPIESWKAYLSYHVLRRAATQLSVAFENEDFDFWGRYLGGAWEQRPRASRCVNLIDSNLGDLLGQKYVQTAFGGGSQGTDHATGGSRGEIAGGGHSYARLDDARNETGCDCQAARHYQ